MSSPSAARPELEAFKRFASELRTEDGDPFQVFGFQETILGPCFDGVPNTVIIMPKKNGKTTLIAALALYHLLVTPNADCIIVAASREQAGICLKAARIFVRNHPELSRLMSIYQRTISLKGEEGRIRVLASDSDTLDGENPTLAIVDELHRHKNLEVYGVLRDGMVRPGARMVTISTAGSNTDSPLGQIRASAHKMQGFVREGTFNHVRTDTFAFFEWCLDQEADVEDMEVVKTANPAPWQTLAKLAERRNEPGMTSYRWLRFACGIWTEVEEPWIEPVEWDGLPRGTVPPGSPVVLGVKVRFDDSAVVVLGDGTAEAHIVAAGDLEGVEDAIDWISQNYQVQAVAYDPTAFRRSALLLEARGLRMEEFPTTPERMSVASVTLKRLIETKALKHPGDEVFRAHVLAGTVKEGERGWRLVSDPDKPISALIALAMAVQTAEDMPAPMESMVAWA